MVGTDIAAITINSIHASAGGRCAAHGKFLVSNNIHIGGQYIDRVYSAEVAGIVLCTAGRVPVTINTHRYVLTPGAVVIYGLRSVVCLDEPSDDARVNLLAFSGDLVKDTIVDLNSVVPIIKYISDNQGELLRLDREETSIMEKYYDLLYDVTGFDKTAILRELLESFFYMLGEMYNKRLSGEPSVRTRREEYLEKFFREVALHHKEEHSVKYYADALHITPKYLSTIIKEASGRLATAWINDFVIHHAKVLLRHSGKSVQEIAYELNFSTQSFFGKFFKRHTGMSPGEYRNDESM